MALQVYKGRDATKVFQVPSDTFLIFTKTKYVTQIVCFFDFGVFFIVVLAHSSE